MNNQLNNPLRQILLSSVAGVLLHGTGVISAPLDTTASDRNAYAQEGKAAISEKRIALVIGNADYGGDAGLVNPTNDARDLAEVLQKNLGFMLIRNGAIMNATRDQMNKAIREFEAELKKNPGAIGLFYYAGHGMELGMKNYLLPIGQHFDSPSMVKDEAISTDSLLERMKNGNARVSLVVLDACRNDPWSRTWNANPARGAEEKGGLAPMDAPKGFLIAFAAQPGKTASDNIRERNGLFTGVLIEEIQKPGHSIYEMFAQVRERVSKKSTGAQLPEEKNVLTGDTLYLMGKPTGSHLDTHQVSFAELSARLVKGDLSVIPELERNPLYQTLLRQAAPPSPTPVTPATTEIIDSRYQILANGAEVKDLENNLIWQRCQVGMNWYEDTCTGKATEFTFDDAQKQAGNGWRVPTIRELSSLIYCSSGKMQKERYIGNDSVPIKKWCDGDYTIPTINTKAFPNTPVSFVWSDDFWYVGFHDGDFDQGYRVGGSGVRLVRGGQ